MKFAFSVPSLLAHTSAILLLGISLPSVAPISASHASDDRKIPKPPSVNSAEDFDEVRNELSRLGVTLPPPQLATRSILQSIAKIEVERTLNLARYTSDSPVIKKFDFQLQYLYKQLANTQPQPDKSTAKILITNAAVEKIDSLEKERSHLINKVTSNHPSILLIDEQKKQL